jgi:hypothetical protein
VFAQNNVSPTEAKSIAVDAYVYGYSLITTEVTRVQQSNVPKPEGLHAPMGEFGNALYYPPGNYRGISAPNADTLYSVAWVDLAQPVVFSYPDMGRRFFLMEMVDMWMHDFAAPGARTESGKAANYLLTGPGWKGTVPAGMKQIQVATRYMCILGRTYADGTDQDYVAVKKLQAQYKLTPLSAWGHPYTPQPIPVNPNPGFSMTENPQRAILAMGMEGYFSMMSKLMAGVAPPPAEDAPVLACMAKIGIVPGEPFALNKLDPAVQAVLKDVPQQALEKIVANEHHMGDVTNGWTMMKGLGTYGTDYIRRATVAAIGWPANQELDAVYPTALVDSTGQPLNGANKYTITFLKGATPPVSGFWSITMYEIDNGWWFFPNTLDKFTVSPRNNLKYNADGSLTLYLQNQSPGADKQANWLPAPKGPFIPMLRMYAPNPTAPSILNGTWQVPPIIKVS